MPKGGRDPALSPAGDGRAGCSAACRANQIHQLVRLLLTLRTQPIFPPQHPWSSALISKPAALEEQASAGFTAWPEV